MYDFKMRAIRAPLVRVTRSPGSISIDTEKDEMTLKVTMNPLQRYRTWLPFPALSPFWDNPSRTSSAPIWAALFPYTAFAARRHC